MATVIDELIIELGLDPRKFTEGQRKALEAFKKTREDADTFGKAIEARMARVSEIFSIVKQGAIGILGAFVGADVARAIDNIGRMDLTTAQLAKTIGMSTSDLSTWEGIMVRIGGTAESARSVFAGLSAALINFRQGAGGLDAGAFAALNQIGANPMKDTPEQIIQKAIKFYGDQVRTGQMTPQYATGMTRRIPGMNQDMINLILMGQDALTKAVNAVHELGVATNESAEAARKYVEAVADIELKWQDLARLTLPAISELLKNISDGIIGTIKQIKEGSFVQITPGGFADRLGAFSKEEFSWQSIRRLFGGGGAASAASNPGGPALPPTVNLGGMFGGLPWRPVDWPTAPSSGNPPAGAGAAAKSSSLSYDNSKSAMNTTTVTIDKLTVNAPLATDADGIAREIGPAIKRMALAIPANYGQTG